MWARNLIFGERTFTQKFRSNLLGRITSLGITLFNWIADSRNGFQAEKPREHDACILTLPVARSTNCERNMLKTFLFYLGHTKFPDWIASRTTRVRKPIYKRASVIDLLDRHNWCKSSYDRAICFVEKDEKSVRETARKISRRHLARFFPFNNYDKCRCSHWLYEHLTRRSPAEAVKISSTNHNSYNFNLRPRTKSISQKCRRVEATNF